MAPDPALHRYFQPSLDEHLAHSGWISLPAIRADPAQTKGWEDIHQHEYPSGTQQTPHLHDHLRLILPVVERSGAQNQIKVAIQERQRFRQANLELRLRG